MDLLNKKNIILSFDDARWDFYHTVYPLLKERGLVATLNVSTGFVDGSEPFYLGQSCLIDDIIEMDQYGIEMALHGDKHLHQETVNDFSACYDKLYSWLKRAPKTVAMPFTNIPGDNLLAFFKEKKLTCCRLGELGSKNNIKVLFWKRFLHLFHSPRYFVLSSLPNCYGLQKADELSVVHSVYVQRQYSPSVYLSLIKKMKKGQCCSFMMHSVGTPEYLAKDSYVSGNWTTEWFIEFLDALVKDPDVQFVCQRDISCLVK
jgi:hypothetical protein